MVEVTIVSYTCYSITVKLTGLTANWPSPNTGVTEERKVTWKYKTSSGSYTTAGTSYLENYSSSTESDNYTFYNLSSDTLYYIQATISHSAWSTTYSFETSQTTQKLSGDLVFRNYPNRTSIKVGIIYPSAGYWRWYRRKNGGSWGNYIKQTWVDLDTDEINFTYGDGSTNNSSLSYGQFYDFKAELINNSGTVLRSLSVSNINCSPSSGNLISNFSSNSWNFLVNSVFTLRGAWSTTYASLDNTLMNYNGNSKILTTTRMKSLWYNIKLAYNSTIDDISGISNDSRGVPNFSTTDRVKADYFYYNIAEGINSIEL